MNDALPLQGLLQSLGWAIIHSFWQMALLWLAYQVLFGWRSRISPTHRHNAAFILLTAGSAWFLYTFAQEYATFWQIDRYLSMLPDSEKATPATAVAITGFREFQQRLANFAETHIAYVSAIYLIVLSFMVWRLLQAFLQSKALRQEGLVPAGPELESRMASLARKLSISQDVRVFVSRLVDVPATMGFIKPIILLPVASLTQLSPSQLESILLHELSHIRRMDYLVNIGVVLMETMHFHNPFARLLAGAIRRERELCCDDLVLSCRQDALEYASALLSLEKARRLPGFSMALASNGHKGHLLHRVRRMTSMPMTRKPYADRLLAVCMMFLLMASMAWIGPATSQANARSPLTPAAWVQEQNVWILNEPQQNLLVKPRRVATLKQEKTTTSKGALAESIDQEIRFEHERLDESISTGRKMVFINQSPPDGYQFQYELPSKEDQDPDILLSLSQGVFAENQRIQLLAREQAIAQEEHRMHEKELESLIEKNPFQFFSRDHAAPQRQIVTREFRKTMEAGKDKQHAAEAAPRIQGQARRSSGRVVAPDVMPQAEAPARMAFGWQRKPEMPAMLLKDKELRVLTDELQQQQFRLMLDAESMLPLHPQGPVKVNRIKTKDGYALRIVTGTESIDIRIGENDIILEKH
jgi:beta-lactamase regulating signal transducer with metallopeptidase domain